MKGLLIIDSMSFCLYNVNKLSLSIYLLLLLLYGEMELLYYVCCTFGPI